MSSRQPFHSRSPLRNGLFVVGPESAGAHPGPVCYNKGGYLAITDANLALGRVLPEFFPKVPRGLRAHPHLRSTEPQTWSLHLDLPCLADFWSQGE
jgi:N-methylhydantoinase A/oxoprolinase/acetone carboxylase beta subunit